MTQRVYSHEEYAAMGYQLLQDISFDPGTYSSSGFDINFLDIPVYRASTKEDAYLDLGYTLLRITVAVVSGGTAAAVPAAWYSVFRVLG
jgi:hypothetical protein